MSDFKLPSLCGASEKFNNIQSKFEKTMNTAIDGLEVDASALKTLLDTDVNELTGEIKSMIPELTALPDVNLQSELTSLSGLSPGSFAYKTKLASLKSKFDTGLSAGGFSLDTLVSEAADITSGKVPKGLIPDLPGLPDVDLQGELTKLSGLSSGSPAHTAMLSGLQSTAGDALAASGTSLDSLVSAAASAAAGLPGAGDMCNSIPNFTIPAAGGDAIEKAAGILQAAADAEEETPSVQVLNSFVTDAATQASDSFKEFWRDPDKTEELPTKDEGAFTLVEKFTTVSSGATTTKVTTPVDAIEREGINWVKKNISTVGFSSRPFKIGGITFNSKFDPN